MVTFMTGCICIVGDKYVGIFQEEYGVLSFQTRSKCSCYQKECSNSEPSRFSCIVACFT